MIQVKSGLKNPEEVALWERDTDHPGGEIFVTGDKVVEVTETSAVMKGLSNGSLVKVATDADKSEKGKAKDGK